MFFETIQEMFNIQSEPVNINIMLMMWSQYVNLFKIICVSSLFHLIILYFMEGATFIVKDFVPKKNLHV